MRFGKRLTGLLGVQKIGKIDAGGFPQGVESPGANIYVEQLEFAIARILLEFDFRQAGIVHFFQEADGHFADFGMVNGFDVVAARPNSGGCWRQRRASMLARARPSLKRRAGGILRVTIAGNNFLNEDFVAAGVFGSASEQGGEFFAIVGAPGFGFGGVEEVFFDGGFDADGEGDIEGGQFFEAAWAIRFRNAEADFFGELVGVPFVPGPFDDFPIGGGHAEPFGEFFAMAGEGGDMFVARGVEDPTAEVHAFGDVQEAVERFPVLRGGRKL